MRCEMLCKALTLLAFFFLVSCVRGDSSGSESERWVLSELKRGVSDPAGVLSSWDSTDLRRRLRHHCSWLGVSCDSDSRVVALRIAGRRGEDRGNDSRALSSPLSRGFRRVRACGLGKLRGQISPSVGKLSQLRVLSLPYNDLFGEIPEVIWGLENLKVLDLEGNSLTGNFPLRFSGLSKLRVLNLGFNKFCGEIPAALLQFPDLKVLNLAGNEMSGSIPASSGSGSCESLERLDLSGNSLTGLIPASLGGCKRLRTLLLFSNNLNGEIPRDLDRLSNLRILGISGNFPRGRRALTSIEVTSKDQDELGSSPQNDTTDYQSGSSGLNSIEVASVASASAIVAVLLALIVLFFYTRKWMPDSRVQGLEPREIITFSQVGAPLTFETIVRSTGNFSASNCIGNGGFGSTFKSELRSGVTVAVKRLSVGRFQQGIQQFHAEVKTLGRVRHPNLVTLLGYHASETEMFLIYNYLPGGNLEKFIKERSTRATDWKILHKIAQDIAHALAYLHDSCVPRVLHRDVKPSNILLDNDLNAYLSDFGLSRLLGTSETHATTGVAGTFGYLAPEYAMTCRVSDKSDVYSYGVVLLELISDKRPLDPSFSSYGDGFNIVSWGSMLLKQGRAKEVFTVGLWDAGPHDDLVEMLHLAITCTDETLSTRPTMKNVVQRLKRLKPVSLGSS